MCAQAAEAPEQQARGQGESFDYDAFISYAHEDRPVAAGIQKGLHRIGRRMGQLHALRVFRDATDLTASPDLWGKVTEAMDRARYLIVVLSSHAVASTWVNRRSPTGCSGAGRISCCSSWPTVVSHGTKAPGGSIRTDPMSLFRC